MMCSRCGVPSGNIFANRSLIRSADSSGGSASGYVAADAVDFVGILNPVESPQGELRIVRTDRFRKIAHSWQRHSLEFSCRDRDGTADAPECLVRGIGREKTGQLG